MHPEELSRRIEEAFADCERPSPDEVTAYAGSSFIDAVGPRLWQELRPLGHYLADSLDIVLLSPKAYRYYLPAYLHALLDPAEDGFYLHHVLDSLWFEEWPDPTIHMPHLRELWEERMPLLTDQQRKCIAEFLLQVRARTNDWNQGEVSVCRRIQRMLDKYWGAFLAPKGSPQTRQV